MRARLGQLFPADVAGLVTLDAFHEDWDEFMAPRLRLGQARQPEPRPPAELTVGKLRLDEALVNSVSAVEQRVLADARHSTIQIDRPDAVAAAIRAVVDRSGG